MKINKQIEIVSSSKAYLSSMSQDSREAVFAVLGSYYSGVRITAVDTLSDLECLAERKPDLVFLGMKFVPVDHSLGMQDPDKVWLTDFLDKEGITYTGSSQMAHELELNKPLAKSRVLDAGLATSPFYVAKRNEPQVEADMRLEYPLFVKPTNRGGGLGIDSKSVVHTFDRLQSKIASIATRLQTDSLIEKYLTGREFSVAILRDKNSAELSLMPIELIAAPDDRGIRILSGRVKAANTERAIPVTEGFLKSRVTTLALDVFHALGARDYGRIDIRLDEFGTPHFLEANLLPSLISGYGSFPKACMLNRGLDYETMILQIVELGLSRGKLLREVVSAHSPARGTTLRLNKPVFEPIA